MFHAICETYTNKLFVAYLTCQLNWVSCIFSGTICQGCLRPKVWETRTWEYASDHFPLPLPSAQGCVLPALLLGLFTLAPEGTPPSIPLCFLPLRRPL